MANPSTNACGGREYVSNARPPHLYPSASGEMRSYHHDYLTQWKPLQMTSQITNRMMQKTMSTTSTSFTLRHHVRRASCCPLCLLLLVLLLLSKLWPEPCVDLLSTITSRSWALANAFTPFSSIISLRTTCTTRFKYKEGTLSMYIRKIGFDGSFCCQITDKNVLAYMGLWVSIIWFH